MDAHSYSTIKIMFSSPEIYAEDREAGKRNVPANGGVVVVQGEKAPEGFCAISMPLS